MKTSQPWTEEELARREKQQNPLDSKRAAADYIIDNNALVALLEPNAQRILASVIASFGP